MLEGNGLMSCDGDRCEVLCRLRLFHSATVCNSEAVKVLDLVCLGQGCSCGVKGQKICGWH